MDIKIGTIPGAVGYSLYAGKTSGYNFYSGKPSSRVIWRNRWERFKERFSTRRELWGETPLQWDAMEGVMGYTVFRQSANTYKILTNTGVVLTGKTENKMTVQTKRWWERWSE